MLKSSEPAPKIPFACSDVLDGEQNTMFLPMLGDTMLEFYRTTFGYAIFTEFILRSLARLLAASTVRVSVLMLGGIFSPLDLSRPTRKKPCSPKTPKRRRPLVNRVARQISRLKTTHLAVYFNSTCTLLPQTNIPRINQNFMESEVDETNTCVHVLSIQE